MDKDTSSTVLVRPGLALLVFGGIDYILLFFARVSIEAGVSVFSAFAAWFASLLFLALRGYWTLTGDAFEKIQPAVASLVTSFLVIVGLIFLLPARSTGPAVFMLLLALPWYCVSSFCRTVDKKKLKFFFEKFLASPRGLSLARMPSLLFMLIGRVLDLCVSVFIVVILFSFFERYWTPIREYFAPRTEALEKITEVLEKAIEVLDKTTEVLADVARSAPSNTILFVVVVGVIFLFKPRVEIPLYGLWTFLICFFGSIHLAYFF